MSKAPNGPREKRLKDLDSNNLENNFYPDQTSRREGGEDSVEQMSPTDNNADEKVIVNQQRENKTVNEPSQTAANTSEGISNDEDIVNNS